MLNCREFYWAENVIAQTSFRLLSIRNDYNIQLPNINGAPTDCCFRVFIESASNVFICQWEKPVFPQKRKRQQLCFRSSGEKCFFMLAKYVEVAKALLNVNHVWKAYFAYIRRWRVIIWTGRDLGGNAIKIGNVAFEVKWVLMRIIQVGFKLYIEEKSSHLKNFTAYIRIPHNLNNIIEVLWSFVKTRNEAKLQIKIPLLLYFWSTTHK